MTPASALVLASLISVQPPILAPAPSPEATVEGEHAKPMLDVLAIDAFVADAANRYSGK